MKSPTSHRFALAYTGAAILVAALLGVGIYLGEDPLEVHPRAEAQQASSASIAVSPARGTFKLTDTIPVKFELDANTEISAVKVSGVAKNLTLVSSNDTNSVLEQKIFDLKTTIGQGDDLNFSFTRISFSSGKKGVKQELLSSVWKPVQAGPASLTITKSESEAIAFADAKDKLSQVTGVSYTITGTVGPGPTPNLKALCLTFESEHRKRKSRGYTFNEARVFVRDTVAAQIIIDTIVKSDSTGKVLVTDPTLVHLLDEAKIYDVLLKVEGHVKLAKQNITNILSGGCIDMGLVKMGDFDGDGTVSLTDLLLLMNYMFEGPQASTNDMLKSIFPNGANLADLINAVRNYVYREKDDSDDGN